jgi:uncharacterized protein DUF4267
MPSPSQIRVAALAMSAIRAGFGLVAIFVPEQAARLLGHPPAHVNPTARIFGGLFGVRELTLAAMVVAARDDQESLRRALTINAAADYGDAAIALRALLLREGIDRGALMTLTPALLGASGWTALRRAAG